MSYHDNQQQNGAVVVSQHHTARNRAMLDRMVYNADADIRASVKSERDELESKKLAEKAADAKRTMGKYAASLEVLAELFHQLEGEGDLSAAERATTEALVREHQRVMAEALREFCGECVDAEKVVSDDTARLRESISSQYAKRPRPTRTQPRVETGKLPTRFCPEQD